MSKIHYEVEVRERHQWRSLTDRKGRTMEYSAAKLAFTAKDELPKSEKAQVVQVFCKRTVIEKLEMVTVK